MHTIEQPDETPRARAAFLHIAKCAGTSVVQSMLDAVGHPPQPGHVFDRCYTAGTDLLVDIAELSPIVSDLVAWDDHPTPASAFTLRQHWSLRSLERHYQPADISTVLREPMSRFVSYLEYTRAVPTVMHRRWQPEQVGLELARASLHDALELPWATRATDNFIVRQVLWGDDRIPVGGFIDDAVTADLAASALSRLEMLGTVCLVEQGDEMWRTLGEWLGRTLQPESANRTPAIQVPGLFRNEREAEGAVDAIRRRNLADSAVWHHFAARCGVDTSESAVEEAVARRLSRLRTSAFFALYEQRPTTLTASGYELRIGTDTPASGAPLIHLVEDGAAADPTADVVIRVSDRAQLNVRDALAGYPVDRIVVGPRWLDTPARAEFVAQLRGLASDHTELVLHGVDEGDRDVVATALTAAGWSAPTWESADGDGDGDGDGIGIGIGIGIGRTLPAVAPPAIGATAEVPAAPVRASLLRRVVRRALHTVRALRRRIRR